MAKRKSVLNHCHRGPFITQHWDRVEYNVKVKQHEVALLSGARSVLLVLFKIGIYATRNKDQYESVKIAADILRNQDL